MRRNEITRIRRGAAIMMIFLRTDASGPEYRFIDGRRAYYERSLQEFGYFV
jgi:hypothetical protein